MYILDASNQAEYSLWCKFWNMHGKEVYSHPDYVALYSGQGVYAKCAIVQSSDSVLLYPFLQREIKSVLAEGPLYDIISPYGYGGINVYGGDDLDILYDIFNKEFSEWALNNNIISEFIRFYLGSPGIKLYKGTVEYVNDNIVVDLTMGAEQMWRDFKPKVRKNVTRARDNGICVEVDYKGNRLDNFLEIYYSTMDRREANDNYYFPRSYFEYINDKLNGQFVYFHAIYEGRIISTELVLVSDYNIYSFLGGTDRAFFTLRPNDLLKYEIINWGRLNSKRSFILGGGYTFHDGIFDYKHAFAPHGVVPFYVGKRVFDNSKYDKLVKMRVLQNPQFDLDSKFFPLYRA